MAVTSIMTTETEIDAKAGKNASASFTEPMKDAAVLQAENYLNTFSEINWSDLYASLSVDAKNILSDVVSSLVAMQWIAYDMSVFTNRGEAESMISLLRDGMLRDMATLRDSEKRKFIKNAS
jgi:acetamidase/formamidase